MFETFKRQVKEKLGTRSNMQRDFLTKLEKSVNVTKPIFIDRNVEEWKRANTGQKIWDIPETDLKWTSQLEHDNVVGRYRIDDSNSNSIYEIWFEIDSNKNILAKDVINKQWKYIKKACTKLIKALNSFGISDDYIYIKSSGRGLHVHVFVKGIKTRTQYSNILKAIQIASTLPNVKNKKSESKGIVWGLDWAAIKSTRRKVREFGAANAKLQDFTHYCSLTNLTTNKYPFNSKSQKVIYPNVKVFQTNEKFINRLHEIITNDITKSFSEQTGKVIYDRQGDPQDLYTCPLIKQIRNKGSKKEHITNSERIFLSQTFAFFGEEGEKEIHKILEHDNDYSESYTQKQIDNVKRCNRKPITCEWAKEHIGCPAECKGITHKTPIMLAWKPPTLDELHKKITEHVLLVLDKDKKDLDVIDVILAGVCERQIAGDPLWMFLVAPSGGGKTELLRATSLWKDVYTIDELTKASFVSGLNPEEKLGILEDMDGKVGVVKDMSQILTSNKDERNAVFGTLRNAYDGYIEKGFGTAKGKISLKSTFGLLIGMTPVIDAYWMLMAQLGERFLKLRFRCNEKAVLDKIYLEAEDDFLERRRKIQSLVTEYLQSLKFDYKIKPPMQHKETIIDLAKFTATMRTALWVRGEGDDTSYVGTREIASRLLKQTMKLMRLLCHVRQKTEVSDDEVGTIARVLLQTPPLERILVFYFLAQNKDGASTSAVAKFLRLKQNNTEHILEQLQMLDVTESNENFNWKLTEYYYDLAKTWIEKGWLKWIIRAKSEYEQAKKGIKVDPIKHQRIDNSETRIDKEWLTRPASTSGKCSP